MSQVLRTLLTTILAGSLFAQTPQTSLGSQPVPEVLQNSISGASASPSTGQLPRQVDHRAFLPPPGYQDRINSCVGWAVAFAAKTHLVNVARGWGANSPDRIFSPSFVYNQINGGQDRGSSIIRAVDLIKNIGAATLQTMPYTLDYRAQPGPEARAEARNFTTESYVALDPKNTQAIRAVLAAGNVVIFGKRTFENFTTYRGGVYNRTAGAHLGGHAMALIGYDDSRGAFLLINSWSNRWGENGYGWIAYSTFGDLTHTAVVMKGRVISRPDRSLPPSTIQASLGSFRDRIQVTWGEVQNVEGYIVFRGESNTGPFREVARVQGTVFLDQRADQGKMYFYTVKSFGIGGESAFSPIANGFLQVPQVLGIPQNVQTMASGTIVKLLWDAVAGADGYNIYRWDDSVEQFRLVGSSKDPGFQDSSLPATAASYFYVVTAVKGQEESAVSQSVSIAVTPPVPVVPSPIPPPTPTTPSVPVTRPTPTPAAPVPVAPAPAVSQLRSVRGARASQGRFSDRVEITWQPVPNAQIYRVAVLNTRTNRYDPLGETREAKFVHRTNQTTPHFYAVTPVAGQVSGPTVDYIMGFASRQIRRGTTRFADESYRSQFEQAPEERFTRAQDFFKDDQFFTNSDKFFDNFVERDFFLLDVEKFFAVDPDFFTIEEGFFD